MPWGCVRALQPACPTCRVPHLPGTHSLAPALGAARGVPEQGVGDCPPKGWQPAEHPAISGKFSETKIP